MNKVQEFMEIAKADESLKAKIMELNEKAAKLSDMEKDELIETELTKLAAEKGFALTKEDFVQSGAGKLSDEELAAVSGGAEEGSFWGNLWRLLMSGFY